MAVETVLMYNCNGEQWAKLRQIFLMLRVRIRPVEADQYGLTLEDLLGRSEEEATVEEEFSDPMLVFCNLPHEKLDHLLTAMGRAGLPRIALKAMLTPTNRTWTSAAVDRAAPGARGHAGPAAAEKVRDSAGKTIDKPVL